MDPLTFLENGFDVHMYMETENQQAIASTVFDQRIWTQKDTTGHTLRPV